MKLYISADIEGVTGIVHWDEADSGKSGYAEFRERMTEEVVAACAGAEAAGVEEILVKDAHATARNIFAERLPRCARLIRVDFIAAGDLLNWVLSKRSENRSVTFTELHRLVALFFGAMGINEHARVQVLRN